MPVTFGNGCTTTSGMSTRLLSGREHGRGHLTLMNFLDEPERFSEVVLTRKRWRTLYSQQFFHEYGIPDKDFDGLPGRCVAIRSNHPARTAFRRTACIAHV